MRRIVCLMTLGLALLWLVPACAQQPTLADVLTGKVVPLEMQLQGMKTGWLQFTIEEQQDGGFNNFFMMMATMGEGGPKLDQLTPRYFTQGQTVTFAGETYLLAYQLAVETPKLEDMIRRRMEHDGEEMEEDEPLLPVSPLTPDTPLRLSMLHLRTAGSLRGIAAFDYERELAENAVKVKEMQRQQSVRNLRQIATGVVMYMQDNEGNFPEMARAAQVVQDNGVKAEMLANPLTKDPYVFNQTLNGKTEGDLAEPSEFALVWEATPGPDGKYAVGFADGHADVFDEVEWKEAIKRSDATVVDEAARERAQKRKVYENLQQMIMAIHRWREDNGEILPSAEDVWEQLKLDNTITKHPRTGENPGYVYNASLSEKALGKIQNLEEMAVFYEPKPWPDGSRFVAFLDTSVEKVDAKQWETVKKDSGIK